MKKKVINKKLQLNKETVARMNQDGMNHIKGGRAQAFTDGCTDGCSLLRTFYNCTHADCTRDCGNAC